MRGCSYTHSSKASDGCSLLYQGTAPANTVKPSTWLHRDMLACAHSLRRCNEEQTQPCRDSKTHSRHKPYTAHSSPTFSARFCACCLLGSTTLSRLSRWQAQNRQQPMVKPACYNKAAIGWAWPHRRPGGPTPQWCKYARKFNQLTYKRQCSLLGILIKSEHAVT